MQYIHLCPELTNVDSHENRRKVLSKWVILDDIKQGVGSPLNTRCHYKEDLEGMRRGGEGRGGEGRGGGKEGGGSENQSYVGLHVG